MMQDATPNSANPLQRYLAWAKPIGRPAAEHDARWRNDQRGADRHPTPAAPRERSARMFGKAATMPCCWHQPPAWLSRMTEAPSMVRADQACPQPAPFAPSLAAQQPSRLPVRVLTPQPGAACARPRPAGMPADPPATAKMRLSRKRAIGAVVWLLKHRRIRPDRALPRSACTSSNRSYHQVAPKKRQACKEQRSEPGRGQAQSDRLPNPHPHTGKHQCRCRIAGHR